VELTGETKESWVAQDMHIVAGDASEVNISYVHTIHAPTLLYATSHHEKNARVTWNVLTLRPTYMRARLSSYLNGVQSQTRQRVTFLGSDSDRLDVSTKAFHNAAHTESTLLTRGAVSGHAKALAQGLIHMSPSAAQAQGSEQHDTLVLSPTAEADAVPHLEIQHNDVSCRHGATIGPVQPDDLYYLMSRGLSKEQATQEVLTAYLHSPSAAHTDLIEKEVRNL
jgi:Fe-S cluster assembly protein SufD